MKITPTLEKGTLLPILVIEIEVDKYIVKKGSCENDLMLLKSLVEITKEQEEEIRGYIDEYLKDKSAS